MPVGQIDSLHHQRNHTSPEHVIRDAGRHLTYLLTPDQIRAKYESYAHAEKDNERDKSVIYIEQAMAYGVDLFTLDLMRVIPVRDLCQLERTLLAVRPELFDFREFPDHSARQAFRWYAKWRARQDSDSETVRALDTYYSEKRAAVRLRAAQAALSEGARYPRRIAGRVKRRAMNRGRPAGR
jgi:hypothetical protein